MNQVYMELSERIRGETADLEHLLPRIQRAWEQSMLIPEEFAFLDSVALNLHSFYSGIERLFEMIAKFVDGGMPAGKTWHRDLLLLMAEEIDEVRPAVIGQESFAYLDELRRFRHLVRNVYTMNLSAKRIEPLVLGLFEHWPRLRAELLAFAGFLEMLANVDEGPSS